MKFNQYLHLEGKHAFLSASKYHWLNYSDDKLKHTFLNHLAVLRGTQLHEFAEHAISLKIKLPKTKKTLNMYVNDVIGHRMETEKIVYFSDNCFGTADAISFKNKELKIFDLKTGATPANMKQLKIYAAIFCLEYAIDPSNIEHIKTIELRIYQSDEVLVEIAEPLEIREIMMKIKQADIILNNIKEEL